ncbi:hypothetical protein Q3G72_019292 [Acer saccharum]|nr:hypothetical protein Q3G72_019292 [Acer saccharum]
MEEALIKAWNVDANKRVVCDLNTTEAFLSLNRSLFLQQHPEGLAQVILIYSWRFTLLAVWNMKTWKAMLLGKELATHC